MPQQPVQAVIFDWAGTTVDHGCKGPAAVFGRAFEKFDIYPTQEEIRLPMGNEKREHVRLMLSMPRLWEEWIAKYGKAPDDEDVNKIFSQVRELMAPTLADFSRPVPDCVPVMEKLREKKIKIGSCTGYSAEMMTELLPLAKKAGFDPDCLVTSDQVPAGRPWPWMCWQNCMRLGVFPVYSVIKVGDTIADIKEGQNAGHWRVGVTRSSNSIGLNEEEIEGISPTALQTSEEEVKRQFRAAGAHYVISTLGELPELCEIIAQRLLAGERP